MKTNFYILLTVLLSFSVMNAQEKVATVNELTVNSVVLQKTQDILNVQDIHAVKSEDEVIAKSSSDIRIYLNKVRNVKNIKLMFPKIYKEEVA